MENTVQAFVRDHAASLGFTIEAGDSGSLNQIRTPGLYRPALELVHQILARHDHEIHLLGQTEISYLWGSEEAQRREDLLRLFSYPFPCCIVPAGLKIPPELLRICQERGVPCLSTQASAMEAIRVVGIYLHKLLTETQVIQGTLVDVGGLGTLLLGEAAVGKSETALALLSRGHRLVADDVVEVRRSPEGRLIGRAPALIGHHVEIRGLGIVDVGRLFGAHAVRDEISIHLVIKLMRFNEAQEMDRTGLDEKHFDFMGAMIPLKTLPVRPGRNLAVVIEVACLDERLKQLGINAAQEFDQKVKMEIARKEGGQA